MRSTSLRTMARCGALIAALALSAALATGCAFTDQAVIAEQAESANESGENEMAEKRYPVQKTDAQWREQLTEEQYRVTREGGTECAFGGNFWDEHREGVYHCICCGNPLFSSEAKFNSGTGWPSYFQPVGPRPDRHQDRPQPRNDPH
jgi:hypothetical protein